MPVTAKLSLRFYEKLGEEIANELVEWFNSVDATYRSDLREVNELNFARFDAKLEQRLALLEAGLEQRFDRCFAEFDRRFTQQDARFTILEARLLGRMEAMHAGLKAELLRWMFGFWTGTMIALAGVLFAVLRAR